MARRRRSLRLPRRWLGTEPRSIGKFFQLPPVRRRQLRFRAEVNSKHGRMVCTLGPSHVARGLGADSRLVGLGGGSATGRQQWNPPESYSSRPACSGVLLDFGSNLSPSWIPRSRLIWRASSWNLERGRKIGRSFLCYEFDCRGHREGKGAVVDVRLLWPHGILCMRAHPPSL